MKPFNSDAPIDPQNLLAAMRAGTDYTAIIRLREFEVRCRPLSMLETEQVVHEVQSRMSKLDQYARNTLTESSLMAKETLKRATSSSPGKSDSILNDYLLEKMTPEEIQHLFKQYVAILDRKNPSLELMSPEDLNRLVAEVKKSPQEELALVLTGLSFSELVALSRHLILES